MKKDFIYCTNFLLILFFIWNLSLGISLYTEGYIWDDLHLIREYSNLEIFNSWKDNWVKGNFETPSYRPIAILSYHLLGSTFGENTLFLRLFLMFLMLLLMILLVTFFLMVGIKKNKILTLLALLFCSKIFATIVSWFTLSVLIISYIFFFLTLISFVYFKKTENIKYLIFSSISCFIAVFSREEFYSLFFIIPILSYHYEKDLKKTIIFSIPFFLIIIIHYTLRGIYVLDASKITLNVNSLDLIGFIKSLIASTLPMSFYKPYVNDPLNLITLFFWVLLLTFIYFSSIRNYKSMSYKLKLYVLFFFIGFVSCLPSLINARSFGIFIPSVFFYAIISNLIWDVISFNKNKYQKIFIFSLVFIGIIGGLNRSYNHLISISKYSAQVISADTMLIYKKPSLGYSVPTPINRKKEKILFLNKLGIDNYVTVHDIKKIKNLDNKIIFPLYSPLSF